MVKVRNIGKWWFLMKKVFIILLQMAFILCIMCSCSKEKVSIINDASFLDDFYIDDETGTVTIHCCITIKNIGNEVSNFALLGYFPKDVGILIEEPVILAKDNETESTLFSIKGNETKQYSICFIGKHMGTYQLSSRLLPDITIITVNSNMKEFVP